MSNEVPKEYDLRSISDFLRVPEDRIEDCLRDFYSWLRLARRAEELNRLMPEMGFQGVTMQMDGFIWKDDGVNGISALDFREEGSDAHIGRLDLPGDMSRNA